MRTLRSSTPAGAVLRLAIVTLTLATGWIHLMLGGLLFTLNGLGYLVAAAAIVGWYLTGPRYDVAYLAKAIEVALIVLLGVEVWAYDGNPIARIGRLVRPLRRA